MQYIQCLPKNEVDVIFYMSCHELQSHDRRQKHGLHIHYVNDTGYN